MSIFNKILDYLLDLKEDAKAVRRKEKRVVARGQGLRGRVYEKPGSEGGEPFNLVRLKAEPEVTLTMTVTRADGSIEIIKVPAKAVRISE